MEQGKMKYCPQCSHPLAPKEIRERERLACDACSYVFYNNPIPIVAAIVEYNDKLLLIRTKAWQEESYGLITGFLEAGETPEAAALREVKEEVGLDGEIVRLIGIYPSFEQNQLILAYHVRAWGEIKVGEEIAATKLIHPSEIKPSPSPRGTGLAVRDWLAIRVKES